MLGPTTTLALHVQDTLVAGAGLCKAGGGRGHGPGGARADPLAGLAGRGVRPGGGRFHLTREGGHSRRRVAHVKDATGREVERALLEACDARGIRILDDQVVVDLVTTGKLGLGGPNQVLGAYVLDRATGEVATVMARAVVLATGGAGKVYLYTTNPDVATGDGVAMAYRAGAAVANLEFFQFHPTCLFHPQAKSFLISEALPRRGRHPAQRRGRALHVPLRPAQGAGPARHRGPLHRRRDEAARRRLRLPGHDAPAPELPARALPAHPRDLPRVRHRHGRAGPSRWCPPPTTSAAAW